MKWIRSKNLKWVETNEENTRNTKRKKKLFSISFQSRWWWWLSIWNGKHSNPKQMKSTVILFLFGFWVWIIRPHYTLYKPYTAIHRIWNKIHNWNSNTLWMDGWIWMKYISIRSLDRTIEYSIGSLKMVLKIYETTIFSYRSNRGENIHHIRRDHRLTSSHISISPPPRILYATNYHQYKMKDKHTRRKFDITQLVYEIRPINLCENQREPTTTTLT